jgi:hypothetical protein
MISPVVDSASGTVKVTIEVTRPGDILRPGMFGTVYIATETHEDAIVIPKKSIIRERDLNFVFTIEDEGTVTRREVETGFTEEDWVEALSGLKEGESLVTVGHETLSEGYPVVVQAWETESGEVQRVATQPVSETPSDEKDQERQLADSTPPGPSESGTPGVFGRGSGGDRQQFFERMLQNPEIKKKWEAKLKEDPSVASDPEKRRAFFREIMSEVRGGRAQQ